ncbi:unnamed protein product [Mytilus edulis]|uniref:Reverse transcriptase domain-containing protein n=1 Tax=Mytilus edulis TaxID=6550 RepID=A0A8S3QC46_MYTED|nr:unnamed protein product [Mytilus edulis]
MSKSDRNDNNFYTLLNNQRNLRSSVTSILKYDNKIINTEEEILDTWASYYEKLATPVDNPDFDNTYKHILEQDISALTDTYTENSDTLAQVSEKEVVQIINSLKNGKAPDACRKKGKPKEDPGSYRKITINNPVGKLSEKLHLVRNMDNISNIQSPLQKGFTQGEIPLVAALILTELHTEAKENGNPLIIALTDAKSAFDVVWHDGLLRENNKAGLCGDNWLLFKDWYKGLNSNIKWQRQTSRTFLESQGVRQGGV